MKFSREKLLHLSNVLFNDLKKRDLIIKSKEEDIVRKEIRNIILKESEIDSQIDVFVKNKLHSYTKNIIEGTPEWDVLYDKFFNEELAKRGRS